MLRQPCLSLVLIQMAQELKSKSDVTVLTSQSLLTLPFSTPRNPQNTFSEVPLNLQWNSVSTSHHGSCSTRTLPWVPISQNCTGVPWAGNTRAPWLLPICSSVHLPHFRPHLLWKTLSLSSEASCFPFFLLANLLGRDNPWEIILWSLSKAGLVCHLSAPPQCSTSMLHLSTSTVLLSQHLATSRRIKGRTVTIPFRRAKHGWALSLHTFFTVDAGVPPTGCYYTQLISQTITQARGCSNIPKSQPGSGKAKELQHISPPISWKFNMVMRNTRKSPRTLMVTSGQHWKDSEICSSESFTRSWYP